MKAKYTVNFICILSTLAFLLLGCESPAKVNNEQVDNPQNQEVEEAKDNNATPEDSSDVAQSSDNTDAAQPVDVAENNEDVANAENKDVANDPHENMLKNYENQVAKKKTLEQDYVDHLITTARKKMAQDKHNEAKAFLDQALAIDPSHPVANRLRDDVGVVLGERPSKSRRFLEEFEDQERVKAEQAKVDARNHYDRGMEHLATKEYDPAISSFTSALEIIRYVPYELNMQALRRKAEAKVKEAEEKKKALAVELRQQRMEEARSEAVRIEEEEQARRATEVRILLTRAGEYYINKKYDKADELIKQVKEKDPLNKIANRLSRDISDARHEHISETTRSKKIDEWKKLVASFREAQIPYADDLLYPDKDWWHNIVSKRSKSTSLSRDDYKKELSDSEKRIRSKLNSVDITLDFTETPFTDVIYFIQNTADINIHVDPKVTQAFQVEGTKVTLNVEELKLKTALDLLMQFYNLVYIFENDVLFITSKDSDRAKGKSIPVLHPIQDLTAQIADFPGPTVRLIETDGGETGGGALFEDSEEGPGNVITDEKLKELIQASIAPSSWDKDENSIDITNKQLLVVNTEVVQDEIRRFLSDMRRFSGTMVAVETRFLDVTDDFLEVLGVDWRGIGDNQLRGNNDPDIPDDDNVIPITGVARGAEDFAGNPDVDPDNIFTTALNNSVNTAAGFFFEENIDLRARTENVDEQALGQRLFDNGGMALEFSFLDDLEMNAVLRAVKKTARQEVLFAPRITTFNTQRAHISIVQQLSFVRDFDVEVAQSAYIADPVIGTIQSGLVLDVRPTVSNDNKYITLEMRPTFADLVGGVFQEIDTTLGGVGVVTIQVPELQLQSVETTVRIPDQGTIMLGGFKSINQQDHKQDIPILGNIPVVSFFFSQQRKVDEKRQVIILVKAKIIDLEEREELAVGKPR